MQGTLFWITGKASLIEQSIQKNGKFLRFFEIWTTGENQSVFTNWTWPRKGVLPINEKASSVPRDQNRSSCCPGAAIDCSSALERSWTALIQMPE